MTAPTLGILRERRCKIVAFIFIIIAFRPAASRAQYQIQNDRILAPEVSHFTRANDPGIDARGDLSLAIPLMTVPGRDGMDFPLVAQYNSGIQVPGFLLNLPKRLTIRLDHVPEAITLNFPLYLPLGGRGSSAILR